MSDDLPEIPYNPPQNSPDLLEQKKKMVESDMQFHKRATSKRIAKIAFWIALAAIIFGIVFLRLYESYPDLAIFEVAWWWAKDIAILCSLVWAAISLPDKVAELCQKAETPIKKLWPDAMTELPKYGKFTARLFIFGALAWVFIVSPFREMLRLRTENSNEKLRLIAEIGSLSNQIAFQHQWLAYYIPSDLALGTNNQPVASDPSRFRNFATHAFHRGYYDHAIRFIDLLYHDTKSITPVDGYDSLQPLLTDPYLWGAILLTNINRENIGSKEKQRALDDYLVHLEDMTNKIRLAVKRKSPNAYNNATNLTWSKGGIKETLGFIRDETDTARQVTNILSTIDQVIENLRESIHTNEPQRSP